MGEDPGGFRADVSALAGDDAFDFEQVASTVEQFVDSERLLQEVVGTSGTQVGHFVLFDHTRNADDFDSFQSAIAANSLANFFAIDIGEHHIQHDEIGTKFLDEHTGIETIVGGFDIEASVALECIEHQLYKLLIIVDDQKLTLATLEGIGGDAIVAHETIKFVPRNASEPAAWDSKALQGAVVEAANNGLLTDFADLGCFACGEYCLR